MSAILIMGGYLALTLLMIALALYLAGRWLKFEKRGFRRPLLVAWIWMAAALGYFALVMSLQTASDGAKLAVELVGFGAVVAIEMWCIKSILGTSKRKAAGGWGITLLARCAATAVVLLMVRPYLVEAFTVPTLSMSPTILPLHHVDVCSRCGGELLLEKVQMIGPSALPERWSGICLKCREQTDKFSGDVKGSLQDADHFMVSKFLVPRRWDIVAYHFQTVIYLKRVVGLPGEEIAISADGQVIIDGKEVGSPPDAPGMRFHWPRQESVQAMKVRPDQKLKLGAAEYFVIGDLAEQSMDSRYTGPVKEGDVVGVVSWIYWPLSRMRVVR